MEKANHQALISRARCCLLAGALGDAIGGVIEFDRWPTIEKRFGREGIQRPELAAPYGRVGAITDDTQMTLFTAEGLIRSKVRGDLKGICHPPSVVHHAYLRWLLTQKYPSKVLKADEADGWLWTCPDLHARRAPGNTCLSALGEATHLGQLAINDSKGCGTVMRVAPIGILFGACGEPGKRAFDLGVETSKLTHGHPTGYFSGGALAAVIADLMNGATLTEAVQATLSILSGLEGAEENSTAIRHAIDLSERFPGGNREAISMLGEGWVAEEALAIALYCALTATSLTSGILAAANHDGDSDSTASIAGQLLGCIQPESHIPSDWLETLELRDEISRMAEDLVNCSSPECFDAESWWDRYPGH